MFNAKFSWIIYRPQALATIKIHNTWATTLALKLLMWCQLLSTVSVCTGQVACGFYFPIWSVILPYLQEVSNYSTEKLMILQESITCNGETF